MLSRPMHGHAERIASSETPDVDQPKPPPSFASAEVCITSSKAPVIPAPTSKRCEYPMSATKARRDISRSVCLTMASNFDASFLRRRRFINRTHHIAGCRLLHHVARTRDSLHAILLYFRMEAPRLLVNIDETIVHAGDDNDRQSKFVVRLR